MTEPRIIQNFVGYSALVVTESAAAVTQLEATLAKLGLSIVHPEITNGRVEITEECLSGDQSILFIDSDINVAVEMPGAEKLSCLPVIGIIGLQAPSRLKSLMRLGMTATLRKPVHGGSVYAALFMGVNEFYRRRALMIELDAHERRRRGRRYLVKAIMAVIHSTGCDEDQAYDRLRRESMRQRQALEEYCEHFIRTRAVPGASEPASSLKGNSRAENSK
jgi:AmiR/NasT family two-component response regulator